MRPQAAPSTHDPNPTLMEICLLLMPGPVRRFRRELADERDSAVERRSTASTQRPRKIKPEPSTPIMTTNSTWAALRNPAFRKLWIAAVISGTCVAAHDSAATWMMNIFTGSPFLISLMSTVASLPFFLFTLPAGAFADQVDRQKLISFINIGLAVAAAGLAVLGMLDC